METGKANNIQAKTFNSDLSEEYHLSVQIGLKQLSYCIINSKTKNVEYFNSFIVNDDITKIINQEENLRLNFKTSRVLFANFPATLIPNELLLKDNAKKILELSTDIYEIIQSDKLTNIDASIIYTIPNEMHDIAFTFFPNAKQKAQQSILIEQFSNFENNKENAYLYINDNNLNITIFKNKKLVFNNSFSIESKEDILYFTLFTLEQLKLDTESIKTKIYGDVIKGDEKHQLLYDYIRNINIGSKLNNLNFSSDFNNFKNYQFYALFCQII